MPTLFCIAMYYLIMSLFFHRGHNLQFRRPEGSRHTVFYIWWPPLWCLKLTILFLPILAHSTYVYPQSTEQTLQFLFLFEFSSFFVPISLKDGIVPRWMSWQEEVKVQFSVSKQIKVKKCPTIQYPGWIYCGVWLGARIPRQFFSY